MHNGLINILDSHFISEIHEIITKFLIIVDMQNVTIQEPREISGLLYVLFKNKVLNIWKFLAPLCHGGILWGGAFLHILHMRVVQT